MLCLFAQHFPGVVASLLQRGQKLRRRFREETITDLLMANLLALGGGSIFVDFPDEPTTGADMEWNFINRDSREHFQILLQAKRLSDTGPDWSTHRYKELFYRSGPSKILQVETLCRTARTRSKATYPAYIFYNLERTCRAANSVGVSNLAGVNLSDANIIHLLAQVSTSRRMESNFSKVRALHPFMFSLADAFCPSNIQPMGPMARAGTFSIPGVLSLGSGSAVFGRPLPPRPDQIRERLIQHRDRVIKIFGDEEVKLDLPKIPEVAHEIPIELERYIGIDTKSPGIERPSLDYWRVTFVSANPLDRFGRPIER